MNFIYFIKKIKKMPKRVLLLYKVLSLILQKKVSKKKKVRNLFNQMSKLYHFLIFKHF